MRYQALPGNEKREKTQLYSRFHVDEVHPPSDRSL